MCTVTFVNLNENIIITSNRDEKITRPKAIAPKTYYQNGKNMFYPKDPKAGGTWYVVDEFGSVIVLLNGAEEKHQVKNEYKKSRGVVVLELIECKDIIKTWNELDLMNIEPFTLVVYFENRLYQLQWNETCKVKKELDKNIPHIWSSSTLYEKRIREKRVNWFQNFIEKEAVLNEDALLNFHQFTENNDALNGLIINRDTILQTLSITQTIINRNRVKIKYLDLQTKELEENNFITV